MKKEILISREDLRSIVLALHKYFLDIDTYSIPYCKSLKTLCYNNGDDGCADYFSDCVAALERDKLFVKSLKDKIEEKYL